VPAVQRVAGVWADRGRSGRRKIVAFAGDFVLSSLAMSDRTRDMLPWLMGVAPVAAAMLVLLWRRGALAAATIAETPPRKVGFGIMDLLLAIMVYFFAGMVAQMTLMALGLIHDSDVPIHEWPAMALGKFIIVSTAVSLLIIALFAALWPLARGDDPRDLGLLPNVSRLPRHAVIVFVAFVTLMPVYLTINITTVIISESFGVALPDAGHELLAVIVASDDRAAVALLIFAAVILAPLVEELFFRVIVQTCMVNAVTMIFTRRRSPDVEAAAIVDEPVIAPGILRWVAIAVTANLFTLVHLGIVPWQTMPSLFIVGVTLGYVYERTGNLWPCIALHALFNITNVALAMMVAEPVVI
jgi:membrane protease YdiL (CAAX protease family)